DNFAGVNAEAHAVDCAHLAVRLHEALDARGREMVLVALRHADHRDLPAGKKSPASGRNLLVQRASATLCFRVDRRSSGQGICTRTAVMSAPVVVIALALEAISARTATVTIDLATCIHRALERDPHGAAELKVAQARLEQARAGHLGTPQIR